MLDALDRGDFATVSLLAHGMRGAGGMFGFPAITEIGTALEAAADGLDKAASRIWVDELSRCLDRAETAPE
jgi:HPt (histidine-containing phosphotransfer) domain-containing protein